jgi:hypothetical protein
MESIEIVIETEDGTVDCNLETDTDQRHSKYQTTVLYPDIVDGYSRSAIYCNVMIKSGNGAGWMFDETEGPVHPKVSKLEQRLSQAIESHVGTNPA